MSGTERKLILTIVLVVVIVIGAVCLRSGCSAPRIATDIVPSLSLYGKIMRWRDYRPVMPVSDPILPESLAVLEPVTVETISGTGVWIPDEPVAAGDSVPVEVSFVKLDDGSSWLKVIIGDKPVQWMDLSRYEKAPAQRRVQAFAEVVAVCDRPVVGFGIGYRLVDVVSVGVVPSVSTTTSLDWAAAEIRLTVQVWSGVSLGGGVGYRIGADPGLHLSGGIGVEL